MSLGKTVTPVFFSAESPASFPGPPPQNAAAKTEIRPDVFPGTGRAPGDKTAGPTEKGSSPNSGATPESGAGRTETSAAGENPALPSIPRLGEFLIGKSSSDKSPSGLPDLILGPVADGNPVIDLKKYKTPAKVDLGPYLYSSVIGGGEGSAPVVPGAGRRGRTSGSQVLSPQARIYDISPWARLAAEHVQKAWAVTPLKDLNANLTVRISVVIDKSGALSSLTVLESSEVPLFDQAALHAVEQSMPFPKLPDDFPEQILEIVLVFESHD